MRKKTRRDAIGVGLAAAAFALQGGCGYGIQLGAMTGEMLMGGGSADDADAVAAQVQLPPLPEPLQPIPEGVLYGHAVLARMRAAGGGRAQKRLWKDEFKDKKVAGHGRVLKGDVKDLFGTMHLVAELDLDDDGGVDVVINFVTTDIMATRSVSEGGTLWYEGTLNEYNGHLMVGGDHVETFF